MTTLFDCGWTYPVENQFYEEGCRWVAGVDEVGRGALAGPVVTAVVVLDRDWSVPGVDDSKRVRADRREALYPEITGKARAWGVDFVENEIIDEINVLQATKLSMERVVDALPMEPDVVLVDALPLRLRVRSVAIVRGDSLSIAIGAASIVAKVTRDRWMAEAAERYPQYGFEEHKGYGTARHLAALGKHGSCPLHRKTFRPVSGMMKYGSHQ